MDDLLSKHAPNVAEANAEHAAALRALRERAGEAMHEAHVAFAEAINEASKAADAARLGFVAALAALADETGAKAETAFAQNCAAIALSSSDFSRELEARALFLRTGELPPPPAPAAPAEEEAPEAQPQAA